MSNLSNEQISSLLNNLTSISPQNNLISESTNLLKQYYSSSSLSINSFIYQLTNNPNENNRNLASILLYKSIDKHYDSLNNDEKNILNETLLNLYLKEKIFIVLKGISYVIYKVIKKNIENNDNILIKYVFKNVENYEANEEKNFELNLNIICDLIKNCTEQMKNKLEIIKEILKVSLLKGNKKMKENSCKCISILMENYNIINNNMNNNNFKEISILFLNEIKNFDNEIKKKIFESLCDYCDNAFLFFDNEEILKVTIDLINNINNDINNYNIEIGQLLCVYSEFLISLCEYNKKLFYKNKINYLKIIFEIYIKFLISPVNNINKENDNFDDINNIINDFSLYKISLNLINKFSLIISSKKLFPIISPFIENLLLNNNNNNNLETCAAIGIIGEISEGCNNYIKDDIEKILNIIIKIFNNNNINNYYIKTQCIITLDSLIQFCSPEINEYYDEIIPLLLEGLNNNNINILEKVLLEINYFFNSIDIDLEDYFNNNEKIIQNFLIKLFNLLNNNNNNIIKGKILEAIGSIINSNRENSEKNINNNNNFYNEILLKLKSILTNSNINNIDEQNLIAATLSCISSIIATIKNIINNDNELEMFLSKFCFNCIKSSVYELQFGGLIYFNALIELKGEQLNKDLIIEILKQIFVLLNDESGINNENNKDEIENSDSDIDDDSKNNLLFNEDFMNVKSECIKSLGIIIKNCINFISNEILKESIDLLEKFNNYIDDTILFDVILAYENILYGIEKKNNQNDLIQFWFETFSHYEEIITTTDNKELVSDTFSCIYKIIDHFKLIIFNNINNVNNNTLQRIIELTKKLLTNNLPCQIKNNSLSTSSDFDHEEEIFDSITDVFLILSKILGDNFHNYFSELFPYLKKYLNPSFDVEDRIFSFGILAEVFRYNKMSVKFYIDEIYNLIDNNLNEKKNNKKNIEGLFRHISYLIGIFFQSDVENSKKFVDKSLNILNGMFNNKKIKKDGKDNIISALIRIIINMKYNKNNFNFWNDVVDKIFENLPFKYDVNENLNALDFLIYTLNIFDLNEFKKYFEKIFDVCMIVIINDKKCKSSKEDFLKIKEYLKTLEKNDELKNLMQNYINNKMNNEEREKFMNVLNNI